MNQKGDAVTGYEMKRPSFFGVIAAIGALAMTASAAWAEDVGSSGRKDPRPDIILIMADDVGYECFGCYGSRQYRTPAIDRLARRGMKFNHCYSQPLCTPSRVKIMTGLSNVRNYSAFSVLNNDQRTIGHYFGDAGYRTLVAGKWQLLGAEHYAERFRQKGTWPHLKATRPSVQERLHRVAQSFADQEIRFGTVEPVVNAAVGGSILVRNEAVARFEAFHVVQLFGGGDLGGFHV